MNIFNSKNISKVIWYNRIICFGLGCIMTVLLIFALNYIPSKTTHYLFNAEIISFSDDILTIKGLPTNTEFTKGTYLINISDDLFLKDWVTDKNVEWGAVIEYKYITVEYTGQEKLQTNSYLKNVINIFVNVDKRIP